MALASAGCEMSSSSYTAGPRPQLPGLWAAELASVASTHVVQDEKKDGDKDDKGGEKDKDDKKDDKKVSPQIGRAHV